MGRRRSEVTSEEKLVPCEIVGTGDGAVKVRVRGKEYTPPEISAVILTAMREAAEAYLGEKVTRAVVTVPAYFNDSQRQATKDAGKIAGLEVERILNEPTAAAFAYGLDKQKGQKIAVFDLGGGTFDISILEFGDGVFEVLAVNGDSHLGGDDWDQMLIDELANGFQKENRVDLRRDPMALQRLKEAAERAKIELSSNLQSTVNLPFITAVNGEPKHLSRTITRARFEALTEPLIERCRKPCVQALKDAGLDASKIDEVILVGGSTRMPQAQAIAKEIFGKEPNRSVNPDEAVAIGAAIQGAILAGERKDIVLLDVTPLSLGIETLGNVTTKLVERNTTIPTSRKRSSRRRPTARPRWKSTSFRGSASLPRIIGRSGASFSTAFPGAARCPEDRGELRHRRERHRLGRGERRGNRKGTEDSHRVHERPRQGGGRADGEGCGVAPR